MIKMLVTAAATLVPELLERTVVDHAAVTQHDRSTQQLL